MISRSIVLDTNVLISAALKEGSNPAEVLKKIISKELVVITCPSIVTEYREVFSRPKFKKWNFPPLWFDFFLSQALWLGKDPPEWPIPGPDQDDLIFLSLAYQTGSTLITGNLKDYPETVRRTVEVVDPAQYLSWLQTPRS